MAKSKLQTLSIDLLCLDGGTQSRIGVDKDTIENYAEVLANSDGEWPFPEIDVFFDGETYFVADGFHRTYAAKTQNRSSVPCRVHQGTAKEAMIFGMTANDMHGLRVSRADKRFCVEWLLKNARELPNKEIAVKAGVTERTVRNVVADQKSSKQNSGKSSGLGSSNSGSSSSGSREVPEHPEDTPAERKRKLKSIIQQHIDRAVRAVDELHEQFPNRAQHKQALNALQGIQLW